MSQDYLRTFKLFDIEEVQKHLIIQGDLSADCGSCRELGLDLATAKHCKRCGTEFKYVTSRRFETNPGERFTIIRRIQDRRPDLIPIDYSDYSKILGKKKARDFFG